MSPPAFALGVDFGTASARTLLLDLRSGEELGVCELGYVHGVIDVMLPVTGERLPTDWALQDPDDYVSVLERGIATLVAGHPEAAQHIVGIGVDVTSCTVMPVDHQGEPLCRQQRWRGRPHAWPKLWKHHAAQAVANRLNEVAEDRDESFLSRYGGRISSEWYFPKLIEIWLEDREIYEAAAAFIEATDWLVWYLTGTERRSACPAAYKAMWSPEEGLPSTAFFVAAFPGFSLPAEKLGHSFSALGTSAGELRPAVAQRLGLPAGIAVAVGNVDSFVSFPGAGAEGEGTFVMVVGTSICDMVVDSRAVALAGITGLAKDGIVPGLYGYEAGQAAAGDMFGWFARQLGGTGKGSAEDLESLERAASALVPGQNGLLALDWWNGNRSVLGDADLSGVLAGLTLQTSTADIYRALMESVAFGNRAIIDNFLAGGIDVTQVVACGGIAEKSPLMMQLLADVSGLSVTVPASSQVPARGSALFGAVAAGRARGGFGSISEAAHALRPGTSYSYVPGQARAASYAKLYMLWKELHDTLGRGPAKWLHQLKRLKLEAEAQKRVVPIDN